MVKLIQQQTTKGVWGDIDNLLTELSTAIVYKIIFLYSIGT